VQGARYGARVRWPEEGIRNREYGVRSRGWGREQSGEYGMGRPRCEWAGKLRMIVRRSHMQSSVIGVKKECPIWHNLAPV